MALRGYHLVKPMLYTIKNFVVYRGKQRGVSVKVRLYDSVVIDFHSASSQALHYLSQCGFEKIGFIGGRESIGKQRVPIQDPREYEYLSYVKSHNAYHPNYIKMGAFTIESGYQLMHEMIKDGQLPEAIWVASDAMAIGAIKACHEKGIHVPNTLSLIGFNDNPQSEFLIPRLSTIRVYKEFMGSLAMELLLERILKERRICKKVIIPTQLVVRESVKPKTPHKEEKL